MPYNGLLTFCCLDNALILGPTSGFRFFFFFLLFPFQSQIQCINWIHNAEGALCGKNIHPTVATSIKEYGNNKDVKIV